MACSWQGSLRSSAPLIDDNSTGIFYLLVDAAGRETAPASLDNWAPASKSTLAKGYERSGELMVPVGFEDPVALKLFKKPSASGAPLFDYVSEFCLKTGSSEITFPLHSWISSEHEWRVFFGPKAYLPSQTPAPLIPLRENELKELRGENLTSVQRAAKRQGADRVYDYQVYNDLGSETAVRPTLGGSARPYPRRIATHRREENGHEVNVGKDPCTPHETAPWMPYDERFNYSKQQGFQGDTLLDFLPAVLQGIEHIPFWKLAFSFLVLMLRSVPFLGKVIPPVAFPPVEDFRDVADVLALYGKDIIAKGSSVEAMIAPMRKHMYAGADTATGRSANLVDDVLSVTSSRRYKVDGVWNFKLSSDEAAAADKITATAAAGPSVRSSLAKLSTIAKPDVPDMPDVKSIFSYVVDSLKKNLGQGIPLADQLLEFPEPRSLEDRLLEWDLDEEMGRQTLAGINPCTIAALKELPKGSAICNNHIKGDLQGDDTLESLMEAAASGKSKPRLFLIDYWALGEFWDGDGNDKPDSNMVQHVGRAIFYLRRREVNGKLTEDDEALVPVAIELASPLNRAGAVYSRSELVADPKTVVIWRLAKAVFKSLDSSYHQLVSHFLRSHACMEPFLIAMRRHMSFMHPVHKLMLPHFRYTMHINANARVTLINAGGFIENNFSAGKFGMRLTSVVYKSWRFRTQALPEDLKARGMLDPKTGLPWMEYPYAEDGLDLWQKYEEYFTAFIFRHYESDEAIKEDKELQAWWHEVKTVGHGDLVGIATEEDVWGFAGPIASRGELVRLLNTIASTASAHHAAVNFGQYDFAGLPLNFSSMVRKPMPVKGDKNWEELINTRLGEQQEKVFLSWLVDVVGAVSMMAVYKILSSHAEDEQTLNVPNQYLRGTGDESLNDTFVNDVLDLEKKFEKRNSVSSSWTRAKTSLNPKTMAYTLLFPTSGPGMTGQGVPYSVSI